jgi:hypothetical protein
MFPRLDLQKMMADMGARHAQDRAAKEKGKQAVTVPTNPTDNDVAASAQATTSAAQARKDKHAQLMQMMLSTAPTRLPGHVEGCTGLVTDKTGKTVPCACVAKDAFNAKAEKREMEIQGGITEDKERAVDSDGFHLVTDEEAQKAKLKDRQNEEWDLLEEAYPKAGEAGGGRRVAGQVPSDLLYDFYSKARE